MILKIGQVNVVILQLVMARKVFCENEFTVILLYSSDESYQSSTTKVNSTMVNLDCGLRYKWNLSHYSYKQ